MIPKLSFAWEKEKQNKKLLESSKEKMEQSIRAINKSRFGILTK